CLAGSSSMSSSPAPAGFSGHVGQLGQRRPQRRISGSAAADPLVRAVEYLAIDIVLALVGRAVAPCTGAERRYPSARDPRPPRSGSGSAQAEAAAAGAVELVRLEAVGPGALVVLGGEIGRAGAGDEGVPDAGGVPLVTGAPGRGGDVHDVPPTLLA